LIEEGTVENAKKRDAESEERETRCMYMKYGFKV
jgi:hypothetical protein